MVLGVKVAPPGVYMVEQQPVTSGAAVSRV